MTAADPTREPPVRDGPTLARQVLAGQPLGGAGHPPVATCDDCGTELAEGQPVVVVAARPAEASEWALRHVTCRDCARPLAGTLGVEQARVSGWVALRSLPAARSHRPVLANPDLDQYSAPGER